MQHPLLKTVKNKEEIHTVAPNSAGLEFPKGGSDMTGKLKFSTI